ncbi:MAG: flagellar hook protein FlgE [Noviherbaspirillum sp.]
MGFQQGLSGLNAASKSLEVIGNNVANANTVGFKAAQAQFADVYAASLAVGNSTQVGAGTTVQQVIQQFQQGNVTASTNPLDIAINGGGFFRMNDNGVINYARNGQFKLDKEGYIVNASGSRLTGYPANDRGQVSTGAPSDLRISAADIAPSPTTRVSTLLNLDSRLESPATTPFSINDPATYNNATSVTVFDSLGNPHVLQTFYVKTGPGTWDVYAAADANPINYTPASAGPPPVPASQAPIGTLQFGTDGRLVPTAPFAPTITVTTGAADFTPRLDFSGTTQFGSTFGVNDQSQDGYAPGRLTDFGVDADGTLVGRYTNGKSAVLGQIALAGFTNPNGLQPLGNNVWAETPASGPALVGTPDSGSLGLLQSLAVEESNVDLTAELVNMITAQRFYQANAQSVKTMDQVLQTLVNLR